MSGLVTRLGRDRRGIALVEFAIVAPVLLLLFFGGYQLCDAIACNRKVTITTRAVADLVSQYKTMSPTELDQITAAATQILAPYDGAVARVRVTAIAVDGSGAGTVQWSRGNNTTARARGTSVTLPSTTMARNATLVLAEVVYPYARGSGFGIFRPNQLSQSIFMVPRVSDTIPCDTCG